MKVKKGKKPTVEGLGTGAYMEITLCDVIVTSRINSVVQTVALWRTGILGLEIQALCMLGKVLPLSYACSFFYVAVFQRQAPSCPGQP